MRKERDILFSLLRCALWGLRRADFPEDIPWKKVISDARRQTVLGLVCDALQAVPEHCQPSEDLLERLMSYRVISVRTHAMLNSRLAEVLDMLRGDGIEPVLFKGQGLAENYPDPTMRQCGDIDLYVGGPDYERACQAAIRHFGRHEHDSVSIKHYHLQYKEVDVELHRIAESLPGIFSDRRFQKWTLEHLHGPRLRRVRIGNADVCLPPCQFDCIYILSHIWNHFMKGGVGLRQVCDWTMYLHRFHKEIDTKTLEEDLRRFGFRKVWAIFADIAVRHLGLPKEECPLYDGRREKLSDVVLEYIFSEGNFGQHSDSRNAPRPEGYTARKLYSFRLWTSRYIGLARFFPEFALKYYSCYLFLKTYDYIKGLFVR